MKLNTKALLLATSIGAACSASAAITVLRMDDTQGGFTTSTALLADTPVNGVPGIGTNDDLWGFAADAGNGQSQLGAGTEAANLFNYAWGSRVDLGENAPTLETVVIGLSSGTIYNIYAYHVTHDSNPWGIQAGLNGGGMTTYVKDDGTVIEDSGLNLERVLLGQVSGTTTVTVDLDDRTDGGGRRSFIKGVGIEAIPEPSTVALLGLGGLALIRRRRK